MENEPNTSVEIAKPKARIVSERDKIVSLDDVYEFEGRTFDHVTIRKLSIGAYREHVEKGGSADILALPMFVDADGHPIPSEVMSTLTVADAGFLTDEASAFLERRSPAAATSSSGPTAGKDSPQP